MLGSFSGQDEVSVSFATSQCSSSPILRPSHALYCLLHMCRHGRRLKLRRRPSGLAAPPLGCGHTFPWPSSYSLAVPCSSSGRELQKQAAGFLHVQPATIQRKKKVPLPKPPLCFHAIVLTVSMSCNLLKNPLKLKVNQLLVLMYTGFSFLSF